MTTYNNKTIIQLHITYHTNHTNHTCYYAQQTNNYANHNYSNYNNTLKNSINQAQKELQNDMKNTTELNEPLTFNLVIQYINNEHSTYIAIENNNLQIPHYINHLTQIPEAIEERIKSNLTLTYLIGLNHRIIIKPRGV